MFCRKCGKKQENNPRFCADCGTETGINRPADQPRPEESVQMPDQDTNLPIPAPPVPEPVTELVAELDSDKAAPCAALSPVAGAETPRTLKPALPLSAKLLLIIMPVIIAAAGVFAAFWFIGEQTLNRPANEDTEAYGAASADQTAEDSAESQPNPAGQSGEDDFPIVIDETELDNEITGLILGIFEGENLNIPLTDNVSQTNRILRAYDSLASIIMSDGRSEIRPEIISVSFAGGGFTDAYSSYSRSAIVVYGAAAVPVVYPRRYFVNATWLNIRSAPDIASESVGLLESGSVVEVLELYGEWGRIENGWCNMNFLLPYGVPPVLPPSSVVVNYTYTLENGQWVLFNMSIGSVTPELEEAVVYTVTFS